MIQLARIFQDGMTLQRCKPIKIWGNSDCRQDITIKLNDMVLQESMTIEKNFSIVLPPQEAMANAVLTIAGTNDTVILQNVDIGEVWIAGGQSNMEFLLRYDAEGAAQIAKANDEHFRFYDVGEYTFPEEEASGRKDNTGWNKWLSFRPEHAEYFSAVGVYFAKQLREKLGIPVAIVGCNWGGTTASSWMDKSYLAMDEHLKEYLDDYDKATQNLDMDNYIHQHDAHLEMGTDPKIAKAMAEALAGTISTWSLIKAIPILHKMAKFPIPMGPRNQNAPGCLYQAMVKQIAPFTCRGVIWYQGESDDIKAQMYSKLFSAMIRCWRDLWQEELPFLFVQLAPFGEWLGNTGQKYPILRQQQEIVSKTVSDCYMVSIMDAGMEKDIHPKRKRPVGERLALLARGKIYGENLLCEAPEFRKEEVEDAVLTLYFTNAGEGLMIRGKKLNAIEVFVDGRNVRCDASVRGDMLCLHSKKIRKESRIEVRFAWTGYCEVNLFNSANLPAKPFVWDSDKGHLN